MKIVLKRIGAYLIDIILVSLLATLLSSNNYINKDYDKYTKTYDEYNDKYSEYNKFYTKLEEYYEDSKISEKEYNKLLKYDEEYTKELKELYENKKIGKKEYNSIIENLNDNYSKIEIDYSYKLLKYSIIPTIINIMCILLYFVVIQFYFNGQTLGKKLMKLRVVKNNKKDLTILNYLFRSLIVNELFINILNIICLIILSKNNYIVYNQIIYVITYILEMTIIFTIVFDKKNRGLHDYISNTKVIEIRRDNNEV